jgi:hypothetical protein
MPVERRGQVTHVGMESTGNRRNFWSWRKAAAFSWGGTSRMNREVHVRICERLGVQFPGPTRPSGNVAMAELRTHLATERVRVVALRLKQTCPSSIPTTARLWALMTCFR